MIDAFVLGSLVDKWDHFDLIIVAIIVICLIWYIKIVGSELNFVWRIFVNTTAFEMRYLMHELQDLYDRDFVE